MHGGERGARNSLLNPSHDAVLVAHANKRVGNFIAFGHQSAAGIDSDDNDLTWTKFVGLFLNRLHFIVAQANTNHAAKFKNKNLSTRVFFTGAQFGRVGLRGFRSRVGGFGCW